MEYKHLELSERGGVLVARLKNASILDQTVSDQIALELSEAEQQSVDNRKLLLDFKDVTFMSSAVLGKLLQLHKLCKNDKIDLKMCSISDGLMHIFKITQLDTLFDIRSDAVAGVASFGKA